MEIPTISGHKLYQFLNMRYRRIPRSDTQNEVIEKLVRNKEGSDKEKEKNKLFSEIWGLLIFASALGYHLGSPLPLKDADGNDDANTSKSIDNETFKSYPDWPGYLYLLSLANTRDSDCLNETEEHDFNRVEIFAEYANAGLDHIRREGYFVYPTLEFAQKLMELSSDVIDDTGEDITL